MNPAARNAFLVALLAFAGVVSHTLPHPMGVSTVGAVGMLAAAYLPRHLTMLPVLLTVLVVDAYNGFYGASWSDALWLVRTPMAMGFYPNTLAGWAACYTNALPFLLNEIVANTIYGGLAFGLIALVGASDARRLFAAKRH